MKIASSFALLALPQRLPRRPLRRVPWRALPSGPARADPSRRELKGERRRSSPTLWARRFWLPIVNPLFHDSFGRRLARNSFEPNGLVATAIRVSPPHGEAMPSIETILILYLKP
jgi:hypothetical protein